MNKLFEKISNKVELLVSSHQKLSKENKDLIEERKTLLLKIDDLKNQIIDLQNKVDKIKISSSLDFSQKYAVKDNQDLLAMCALSFSVELHKYREKTNLEKEGVGIQLDKLDQILSSIL